MVVVCDGSKILEADILVSYTENLFSKPPQSAKAEKETVATIVMVFC